MGMPLGQLLWEQNPVKQTMPTALLKLLFIENQCIIDCYRFSTFALTTSIRTLGSNGVAPVAPLHWSMLSFLMQTTRKVQSVFCNTLKIRHIRSKCNINGELNAFYC